MRGQMGGNVREGDVESGVNKFETQILIIRCRRCLMLFSPSLKKFETQILITNSKMIWWSIYGGSKEPPSLFICLPL
jgi:hypothetical protein